MPGRSRTLVRRACLAGIVGPVNRHEFLRHLHATTRPRSYLEIGVNDGRSLAISRTPSVAVDPDYRITAPLRCDLHLVRSTSDEFFARPDPINHLRSGRNPIRNLRRGRPPFAWYRGGTVVDLAFIDGMHLFEYALRDFMNVECFAGPASAIVLDDMLPRNVDEAARDRHTQAWTGDVYKLAAVLRQHRPDLLLLPMDTQPTGVLVVLGADPASTILRDRYERLLDEWVVPDPQRVPPEIIERRGTVDPEGFFASSIPAILLRGRRRHRRARLLEQLRPKVAELTRR
jgi:hypothetical protein